jgi:hypothetical protein
MRLPPTAHSMWVIFWGAVFHDNLCIHDNSIFRDAPDFSVGEIENSVGVNCDTFFFLGKAIQFLDIAGTHRSFKAA